tara:strand:- start:3183 stop:3983 length:801 start_codon:yes stop_codon:yes gene_type:complete
VKKPINHPYQKFNSALEKTVTKEVKWSSLNFSDIDVVVDLWNKMSARSKAKVVSDLRWNHYPIVSYSKYSKKRFGLIIKHLVLDAFEKCDQDTLNVLEKKSEGVFAINTLDNATSSVRVRMAKRLLNSKDYRVRTRCARILPVKNLNRMIEDKHYSVRNIVITRIGMDNCYKDFIPDTICEPKTRNSEYWYKRWLNRNAIRLSERSELTGLIQEARNLDTDKVDLSKIESMLSCLIDRLTPEEAIYFMGLGEESRYIKSSLERKLY